MFWRLFVWSPDWRGFDVKTAETAGLGRNIQVFGTRLHWPTTGSPAREG
jgi:hypothetical protein